MAYLQNTNAIPIKNKYQAKHSEIKADIRKEFGGNSSTYGKRLIGNK